MNLTRKRRNDRGGKNFLSSASPISALRSHTKKHFYNARKMCRGSEAKAIHSAFKFENGNNMFLVFEACRCFDCLLLLYLESFIAIVNKSKWSSDKGSFPTHFAINFDAFLYALMAMILHRFCLRSPLVYDLIGYFTNSFFIAISRATSNRNDCKTAKSRNKPPNGSSTKRALNQNNER